MTSQGGYWKKLTPRKESWKKLTLRKEFGLKCSWRPLTALNCTENSPTKLKMDLNTKKSAKQELSKKSNSKEFKSTYKIPKLSARRPSDAENFNKAKQVSSSGSKSKMCNPRTVKKLNSVHQNKEENKKLSNCVVDSSLMSSQNASLFNKNKSRVSHMSTNVESSLFHSVPEGNLSRQTDVVDNILREMEAPTVTINSLVPYTPKQKFTVPRPPPPPPHEPAKNVFPKRKGPLFNKVQEQRKLLFKNLKPFGKQRAHMTSPIKIPKAYEHFHQKVTRTNQNSVSSESCSQEVEKNVDKSKISSTGKHAFDDALQDQELPCTKKKKIKKIPLVSKVEKSKELEVCSKSLKKCAKASDISLPTTETTTENTDLSRTKISVKKTKNKEREQENSEEESLKTKINVKKIRNEERETESSEEEFSRTEVNVRKSRNEEREPESSEEEFPRTKASLRKSKNKKRKHGDSGEGTSRTKTSVRKTRNKEREQESSEEESSKTKINGKKIQNKEREPESSEEELSKTKSGFKNKEMEPKDSEEEFSKNKTIEKKTKNKKREREDSEEDCNSPPISFKPRFKRLRTILSESEDEENSLDSNCSYVQNNDVSVDSFSEDSHSANLNHEKDCIDTDFLSSINFSELYQTNKEQSDSVLHNSDSALELKEVNDVEVAMSSVENQENTVVGNVTENENVILDDTNHSRDEEDSLVICLPSFEKEVEMITIDDDTPSEDDDVTFLEEINVGKIKSLFSKKNSTTVTSHSADYRDIKELSANILNLIRDPNSVKKSDLISKFNQTMFSSNTRPSVCRNAPSTSTEEYDRLYDDL